MPNEKEKPEIKVTDKRIFTAEGDIREEFRAEIRPDDRPAATAPAERAPSPEPPRAEEERPKVLGGPSESGERRKTMAAKAGSPGTPFGTFVEGLIAQAYISLGMMRSPYQPQTQVDAVAARQMIDILALLKEKTAGNLTQDEEDLLTTHLSQLKLAYVQVTKSLS